MAANDVHMIDRRILLEARTLAENGFAVTVIAGFECEKPEEFELEGVLVKRLHFKWGDPRVERIGTMWPFRTHWFFRRVAQRIAGALIHLFFWEKRFDRFVIDQILEHDFDILHVHDSQMLKGGVLASRRRGVPLIYDAHELQHVHVNFTPKQQRFWERLEKRFIRFPNVVVTVNPFLAKVFADLYGIRVPDVILNAAENKTIEDQSALKMAMGVPNDAKVVLFQGWLSDHRRLDILVRAVSLFNPNIYLAIIGYGSELEPLKDIARENGTEDRVWFPGAIESENLHDFTTGADLGIIPYAGVDENHINCSPNKLFEYISAAVPVLANDLPYLRSVLEEHDIGRVVALTDERSFADAINGMLEDEALMIHLRENTLKAREVLNWNIEGRKLLDIFERLLDPGMMTDKTWPGAEISDFEKR